MCVKFKKPNIEQEYEPRLPLADQLIDTLEILIEYSPNDKSIISFVKEMEKLTKFGFDDSPKIFVKHNNYIIGAKVKKKIEKISKDITFNKLMKLMARSHFELDKKLQEIAVLCVDRK